MGNGGQAIPTKATHTCPANGTDTAENMAFSKEKILAVCPEAKVAFATTNYHVFRSGLKARRVKLRAQGMGCRSKWYFWPNAAVREFVGLLTQHRVKQGLILVGLIASYVLLTALNYRLSYEIRLV